MINKLVILVVFVVTAITTFFVTKGIYHNPPAPPNIEYVQGPERTVYIQGKTDTVFRTIKAKGSQLSALSSQQSSFAKAIPINDTDTLQLTVKTFPAIDSIDLSYVFKIKIRDTHRTDTLYLSRIDTVRIAETMQASSPKRFYEQPLLLITAGALAGCLTTIYILK